MTPIVAIVHASVPPNRADLDRRPEKIDRARARLRRGGLTAGACPRRYNNECVRGKSEGQHDAECQARAHCSTPMTCMRHRQILCLSARGAYTAAFLPTGEMPGDIPDNNIVAPARLGQADPPVIV